MVVRRSVLATDIMQMSSEGVPSAVQCILYSVQSTAYTADHAPLEAVVIEVFQLLVNHILFT